MSSWGPWSKISKLRLVRWPVFFFFGPKSSLLKHVRLEILEIVNNVFMRLWRKWCKRTSTPTTSLWGPASQHLHNEREARVYGWMGWDRWAGISKVSFNFLHTLWAFRKCIYEACQEFSTQKKGDFLNNIAFFWLFCFFLETVFFNIFCSFLWN